MKNSYEVLFDNIDLWMRHKHVNADWRAKNFDCFANFPDVFRRFIMMSLLENEITNGGLAQFMWQILGSVP